MVSTFVIREITKEDYLKDIPSPKLYITASRFRNGEFKIINLCAKAYPENTKVGQKSHYTSIGAYHVPTNKKGVPCFDFDLIIPFWKFVGCIPPLDVTGKLLEFHYESYPKEIIDFDTVEWLDGMYSWEFPPLESKYWPRQGKMPLLTGRWLLES